MTTKAERIRSRLAPLASNIGEWKSALDHIDPDCECVLDDRPGFQPMNNASCRSRRRCRDMTVLTIRTDMGMTRIHTRHLSAAQIPTLVEHLAALMNELPTTTDWDAYARRLAQTLDTGRDPKAGPAEPSRRSTTP